MASIRTLTTDPSYPGVIVSKLVDIDVTAEAAVPNIVTSDINITRNTTLELFSPRLEADILGEGVLRIS